MLTLSMANSHRVRPAALNWFQLLPKQAQSPLQVQPAGKPEELVGFLVLDTLHDLVTQGLPKMLRFKINIYNHRNTFCPSLQTQSQIWEIQISSHCLEDFINNSTNSDMICVAKGHLALSFPPCHKFGKSKSAHTVWKILLIILPNS